jgi:hypothetical protein
MRLHAATAKRAPRVRVYTPHDACRRVKLSACERRCTSFSSMLLARPSATEMFGASSAPHSRVGSGWGARVPALRVHTMPRDSEGEAGLRRASTSGLRRSARPRARAARASPGSWRRGAPEQARARQPHALTWLGSLGSRVQCVGDVWRQFWTGKANAPDPTLYPSLPC